MPRYNPELVTFTEGSEEDIAVVTILNLVAFRDKNPGNEHIKLDPLIYGAQQAARTRSNGRLPKRSGHTTSSPPAPYVHKDRETFGIIADEAPRLLEDLQSGVVVIREVGEGAIELFDQFCAELYLENQPN